MKTIWMIGFLILCMFCSAQVQAAVWVVDDDGGVGVDFTVIQDCLDAAGLGDTCQVRGGAYMENLTWPINSGITLAGDDPATCVVDGNGADPVITVHNPFFWVTALSIRGLGITNGGGTGLGPGILVEPTFDVTVNLEGLEVYGNADGGIVVTDTYSSSAEVVLSVVNSRIMNNAGASTAFGGAAGILLGGVSVDLNVDGCEIFQNDLAGIFSGFMDDDYITGKIANNRIHGNSGYVLTELMGFGIYLGAWIGNDVIIENNEIFQNRGDPSLTAKSMGIFLKFDADPYYSSAYIHDNTVYDHVAELGEVAGIGVDAGSGDFTYSVYRNLVFGNRGTGGGALLPFSGGLICKNAGGGGSPYSDVVFNNVIASNGPHGIGLHVDADGVLLQNNTVVDSLSVGVEYFEAAAPTVPVASNLIIGDWDSGSGATDLVGNLPVTYSDVQDGAPDPTNISVYPDFVDPDGTDDTLGTPDDDYHILPGSPCIKTGGASGIISDDFDGDTRTDPVDMGADEYVENTAQGTSVQVDLNPECKVRFAQVSSAGQTTLDTRPGMGVLPAGYLDLTGSPLYDIRTGAGYTGSIDVCLSYTDEFLPAGSLESRIEILHEEASGFADITASRDAGLNEVCGVVDSLSDFILAYVPEGTCMDSDSDGYGLPGEAVCPAGAAEDCDDESPGVNPGAAEICNNLIDDDCDGDMDCNDSECVGNPACEPVHQASSIPLDRYPGSEIGSSKIINYLAFYLFIPWATVFAVRGIVRRKK